MEQFLNRLTALYDRYLETVKKLVRERKPGEGMFGFGGGPANNPCHDRFAEDLAVLLGELTEENAPSALRRRAMELVYTAPLKYPEPRSAYWMLLAVHGLTHALIPGLTAEDADALAALYEQSYPRRTRLPVQIETLDLLRKAGSAPDSGGRRSLFRKK